MYNRIYVKGRSMSIKKKRLLTLAGIIAFAALIIALFLFAVKQRDANTSGDFGTIQYTTLGTIQEMDLANGIVTVRIHGEDEDYNYEYKRVLHYLEDEQLDLLASDGMLVKRPILVTEMAVLVGFREADWAAALL